jgi:hypothetical protein
MTSLDRPWAAKRTILTLMTSRYGDVFSRSGFEFVLFVSGKDDVKWAWPWHDMMPPSTSLSGLYRLTLRIIRHRIYEFEYLARQLCPGQLDWM